MAGTSIAGRQKPEDVSRETSDFRGVGEIVSRETKAISFLLIG
jgi:hypothetical protein